MHFAKEEKEKVHTLNEHLILYKYLALFQFQTFENGCTSKQTKVAQGILLSLVAVHAPKHVGANSGP